MELAGEGDLDSIRLVAVERRKRVGLLGRGVSRIGEDDGEVALGRGGGES